MWQVAGHAATVPRSWLSASGRLVDLHHIRHDMHQDQIRAHVALAFTAGGRLPIDQARLPRLNCQSDQLSGEMPPCAGPSARKVDVLLGRDDGGVRAEFWHRLLLGSSPDSDGRR